MIFDEAHELEDVASNYFGIGLSNLRFEELVRDVETMLRRRSSLRRRSRAVATMLRDRGRMFFAALPVEVGDKATDACRSSSARTFWKKSGDTYLGVMNALHSPGRRTGAAEGVDEAPGLRKRAADIATSLKFLLEADSRTRCSGSSGAAGAELARGGRNTYLQATPIDVSRHAVARCLSSTAWF